MAEPARPPPRPRSKLGVIARLGERLSSDERAPYERVDHEDELQFDDPTGDQLVTAERTSEGGGEGGGRGGTRGGKGEP